MTIPSQDYIITIVDEAANEINRLRLPCVPATDWVIVMDGRDGHRYEYVVNGIRVAVTELGRDRQLVSYVAIVKAAAL